VVVDDSRLARSELCELVAEQKEHSVIGEAENIQQAVSVVDTLKPDLLLLDIHLPDGDGFSVLEQCEHLPKVIFTTAYDQYAVRAFAVNALDYLLKPIERERFLTALTRAEQEHTRMQTEPAPQPAPEAPRKSRHDQIFIRDGEACHFVRLNEVFLFEVDGNYTRVHFRDQRPLMLRSLGYLEQRLDPTVFFRANRQQIINLDYVSGVESWVNEGLLLKLKSGQQIESSRRQARELKALLEL
jgi:two-component system LytT family response regulator